MVPASQKTLYTGGLSETKRNRLGSLPDAIYYSPIYTIALQMNPIYCSYFFIRSYSTDKFFIRFVNYVWGKTWYRTEERFFIKPFTRIRVR